MAAILRTVKGSAGMLRKETPRPFSSADKSLIDKVHGYMPAQQLLAVLNERLAADLGPDEPPHTLEQLYAEIGSAAPEGGHDWTSIRKLVADARRAGVLSIITRQVIDDFAAVFALTSSQVTRLRDVLLSKDET